MSGNENTSFYVGNYISFKKMYFFLGWFIFIPHIKI